MSITVRGSKELGYIYRANNKGVGVEGGGYRVDMNSRQKRVRIVVLVWMRKFGYRVRVMEGGMWYHLSNPCTSSMAMATASALPPVYLKTNIGMPRRRDGRGDG